MTNNKSSNGSSLVDFIPNEIKNAAEEAIAQMLPKKSRNLYEKRYEEFEKWCNEKQTQAITEDVLLAYFFQKSKTVKASTLWSQYSMIKAMLVVKHNIDISKYARLIAFLKRTNDDYKPKKSKILTAEQVDQFLSKAPDSEYLMTKVALILGVAGACRGVELVNLSINDVEDMGSSILFHVKNTKNKLEASFSRILRTILLISWEYAENTCLFGKPIHPILVFFVGYKNNQCTLQAVGKNTFCSLPKTIASFLKLSEPSSYTGHCFRRTSASLLADSGANVDILKRHGGWKSATVAEGYVELSTGNKKNTAERILGREGNENKENVQPTNPTISYSKIHAFSHNGESECSRLFNNIVNCNDVHITVNVIKHDQ